MGADTVIRAGRPADAQQLAALATQVFLHTDATRGVSAAISGHVLVEFTVEKFQALLNSETTMIFVAEERAHLVGYARVDSAAQRCSKIGTAQFVLGGERHENHVLVASDPRATAQVAD